MKWLFSPRLFLKFRGGLAIENGKNNSHESINKSIWQTLFEEKMEIVQKFFGKPKEVFLNRKNFFYPSVHCVLKWEGRFFSAFFTPLFSGEIQMNTFFEINEK